MEQFPNSTYDISLSDPYTERSLLVYGDDIDHFKTDFETIGGKRGWGYTPKELNGEKVGGFIFSFKRRDQVVDLLDDIFSGKIEREEREKRKMRVKPTSKASPKASPKSSPTSMYPGSPKRSPIRILPKGTTTVSLPRKGPDMQTITYNIIKPSKGMKLIIKMEDASDLNAFVSNIPESEYNSGGVIQLVEISLVDDTDSIYDLGIVNGEWQIIGTSDFHKIKFIY